MVRLGAALLVSAVALDRGLEKGASTVAAAAPAEPVKKEALEEDTSITDSIFGTTAPAEPVKKEALVEGTSTTATEVTSKLHIPSFSEFTELTQQLKKQLGGDMTDEAPEYVWLPNDGSAGTRMRPTKGASESLAEKSASATPEAKETETPLHVWGDLSLPVIAPAVFAQENTIAKIEEKPTTMSVASDGKLINLRKAEASSAVETDAKTDKDAKEDTPDHDHSLASAYGGGGGDGGGGWQSSQDDMGVVGWASVPQRDVDFEMKTLGFTFFLACMYYSILLLGLTLTYKTALLHPDIKFFSGVLPQHLVCRSEGAADIIRTFNRKPKIRMRVQGKGLDFALDLSTYIQEGATDGMRPVEEFVRSKDPLRTLKIQQKVSCPAAVELEKRVRAKLALSDYPHPVKVTIPLVHTINVYRNDTDANFCHNRTTRLLFAMSIFGLAFWPYSWIYSKSDTCTSNFRLNLDVERFWSHVGPRIHRGGFRA